jgi:hypothetical protein
MYAVGTAITAAILTTYNHKPMVDNLKDGLKFPYLIWKSLNIKT